MTVAVTVAVTIIGTLLATPQYAASTTIRIATATSGAVDWVNYDITYADRLMNTYARLTMSDSVLEELKQRLTAD